MLVRIVTALVTAPLVVALVVWGPWWGVPLFTVALVGIAAWEFHRLARPDAPVWSNLFGSTVAAGASAAWLFWPEGFHGVLALGTLALILSHLTMASELDRVGPRLSATLAALVYTVFTLTHIGLLYGLEDGWRWVFLVLLFTFMGDTGAYFTGKAIGRHKLAPRISPKKTWEGSAGGLVASVAAAMAWSPTIPSLDMPHAALLGLVGGALGQLGDLGESLLKRSAGVKDSGSILPGHGGVLDRFDAVSFSAPIVYYYVISFVVG